VRGLLLGDERARLDALQRRLDDPARRIGELSEVLPDAVRAGAADKRLVSALQAPVDACIQHSVERDPQQLADALFPVMGPAIRRAISETLRGFVQSINQAVEHSLSIKGLRWRIEAWRSGSSFAEVVFKNTLLYRVDAAYLIHNNSGLLIDCALAETQTTLKDEDAISAMLTAIQDFVQDSFSHAGESLETVEIGGRTLWVLRGLHATLACVISGLPPQALRRQFDEVLADLHRAYGRQLADFDGDKAPLAAVQPLLRDCLALEYRDTDVRQRPLRWWPWLALLLLLGLALGWLWWRQQAWDQRLDAAREQLRQTPGVVLLDWQPGPRIRASLLVDPLADEPAGMITDAEIKARLDIERRPFLAADPPIVLARARQQLTPPSGVTLTLDQGVLQVAGAAPSAWIERLRASPVLPSGVQVMDLSALMPDHSDLLPRVRAAIEPPASVETSLDGAALILSGRAPWHWIDTLPVRLAGVVGLRSCDSSALTVTEVVQARALAAELERIEILFVDGADPLPGSATVLDRAALLIEALSRLDADAPLGARIALVGHSDGLGTQQWNYWLRQQRADFVMRQLAERGAPERLLRAEPERRFEPATDARPAQRRVSLHVSLERVQTPACNPLSATPGR
jgi:OOP family OmpA-OmpF porin